MKCNLYELESCVGGDNLFIIASLRVYSIQELTLITITTTVASLYLLVLYVWYTCDMFIERPLLASTYLFLF